MIQEITVEVDFIIRLLSSCKLDNDQKNIFHSTLLCSLSEKFSAHWDPSQPLKGNAYRSILITEGFVDPVILKSASMAGLSGIDKRWFPSELIIWIDPSEVTYRIGEKGSVANLSLTAEEEGEEDKSCKQQMLSSVKSPSTPIKISSPRQALPQMMSHNKSSSSSISPESPSSLSSLPTESSFLSVKDSGHSRIIVH